MELIKFPTAEDNLLALEEAKAHLADDVEGVFVVFTYHGGQAVMITSANVSINDVFAACGQVQYQQYEYLWEDDE